MGIDVKKHYGFLSATKLKIGVTQHRLVLNLASNPLSAATVCCPAGQNTPRWQRLCHIQGHFPVYNIQTLQRRGARLRGVTGQQGEQRGEVVRV
jgi:hypothetical protein